MTFTVSQHNHDAGLYIAPIASELGSMVTVRSCCAIVAITLFTKALVGV